MLYPIRSQIKYVVFIAFLFAFAFSHTVLAVEFSLFGDVRFVTADNDADKNSFGLGQIDLIANQDIGPQTNVTVELVFEDAGAGDGTTIDIERFSIVRNISTNTQFGFGRYHTPLGFWNSYYHHGSLIQNTATRPFFLEFEDAYGGIMPVHMVGINLSGKSKFLNYQMILGNSNGWNTTSPSSPKLTVFNNSDLNDDKSYVLRAGLNLFNSDLEFAVNFLKNNVLQGAGTQPLSDQGKILFEQQISGLSVKWNLGNFNMLSEYYQMDITDPAMSLNTGKYDSTAFYTQFSYHMSPRLTVVLRNETLDFDFAKDSYLKQLVTDGPETRNILSLSYNIEKSNALRFEFSQRTFDDTTKLSFSSYTFQWYFLLM